MRRKILIPVLLIACLPFHAQSQTVGIEAGLKLPQAVVEYSGVDMSRKIGFELGIFLQKEIGNGGDWNSRISLLYSYSGFSLGDNLGGGQAGITYHFVENSAKLPLVFEWHPGHSRCTPFGRIGLYSSYAIRGRLKAYGEDSGLHYQRGGDRFDVGSLLGVGVNLIRAVGLTANYEFGLRKRRLALGDQFVLVRNRAGLISLSIYFK